MTALRLVLASAIFPPDAGGPATFIPELARRLSALGHSVTVVAVAPDEAPETRPYRLVKIPRSLPTARRLFRAARVLAREGKDADAFFVNTLELPAIPVARLLGKPVVVKVVGDVVWERAVRNGWTDRDILSFQEAPSGIRLSSLRRLYSSLYRAAHRVVVPSRFLGGLVRGWGVPGETIRVVPNAVEDLFFSQRNGSPYPPGLRLTAAARLVPWKGVDGIIRALAALPADSTLRVLGDGPSRAELERLASSMGLSERVSFEGHRSKDELAAALKETDVFVLNSTYEGFPHSVLEAMASGCAVVATSAGGTPELLKDGKNALLVRPGDAQGLRAALARAADPALRERLARGGMELASSCRWELCVERTVGVIRELL